MGTGFIYVAMPHEVLKSGKTSKKKSTETGYNRLHLTALLSCPNLFDESDTLVYHMVIKEVRYELLFDARFKN